MSVHSAQTRTGYVAGYGRPSRASAYGIIAFAAVSLSALFMPLGLLRRRRAHVGKRARRRRAAVRTLAMMLLPLMAVGPERVQAMAVEANLYCAVGAAALGAAPASTVKYAYTYDDNGNTLREERLVGELGDPGNPADVFGYDFENRLVSAAKQFRQSEMPVDCEASPPPVQCCPGAVTYAYDADGIRRSMTRADTTTLYLTDKNRDYAQVLEERDGTDALIVQYTYGDDLIAQQRGANVSYYLYDGQLSTRQLANATAAVTDRYVYDAFGVRNPDLSDDTHTTNSYRYAGEQYDCNVGLYYLRARYYDQGLGRFATRDTHQGVASDPRSLHKYAYAHASPVDCSDPSGESAIGVVVSVGILVALTVMLYPNVANAPAIGDPIHADRSGDMVGGAVLSLFLVPPIAKVIGAGKAVLSSAMARILQRQGVNVATRVASEEVVNLGRGTVFAHFTSQENAAAITGLSAQEVAAMKVGDRIAVSGGILLKPGPATTFAAEGGSVFVTDLGVDASAGELSSIGVRAAGGRQNFAIQFSDESAFNSGVRFSPLRPGIYAYDGEVQMSGQFLLTRVR